MAYKVFSNGNTLNGSELNTYLMNQAVISFASTTARDAAITSPLEGQLVWLEDTNKYVYYTGSAWADLITPASSGNAIINGAFDFWQRGTSFTPAAAGAVVYTADRFAVQRDGTGATVTVSQQSFTPGTAPVSGYESAYYLRFAQSVAGTGGTYNQLFQRIENVRSFAGQAATFSFWAKADAATTLQQATIQAFGSGGSADVVTTGSTQTITTSWARYTYTFTVPSVSGKTIGTSSSLQMGLFLALNTAKTVDFWGFQLESGSTATAFKRNASNIQGELAACQRYFEKSYDTDVAPGTATNYGFMFATQSSDGASNSMNNTKFRVEKRNNNYSKAFYTPGGTANKWQYSRSGVGVTDATPNDYYSGTTGLAVYINVGASWTSNQIQGQWVVDNEL